ncbi:MULTISPECIES: hypothetical protein [Akkermansia]|uniref:hypothetical protein n=1 Tax=Akkermansia TaxID=239934 RepID=UPI000FE1700B|nr:MULTISPECIES: hypothetical protein [Akkermansia]KAA4239834.1 hypothetical protein F3D15_19400 [Bacteroides ovatus]KAA3321440.1 hypothetical protein F1937_04905 [Akkermansia muciniphila]KAA3324331.1 hypothetical protein F1963_01960 [Akkermansia muciniphila]KAA3325326.1 hypothetical protein F1931_01960 [Akkermansia muciniphila]KAA3328381.1 hypothetical protein F1932_01970 [Akkermansia muciniphila]
MFKAFAGNGKGFAVGRLFLFLRTRTVTAFIPAGSGEGRETLCFFLSVPEGTEKMKREQADAGIAYD